MARKLDTARTYKVLKFIVLTVSILSLLVAIWSTIRFDSAYEVTRDILDSCLDFEYKTGTSYTNCEADYSNDLQWLRNMQIYPFIISVVLPVLFFGGNALLNYIAPKEETDNGKKDSN